MSRLRKLNNQRYEYFIVNYNDNINFYNHFLLLLVLTECKPNFELSSFPFVISVPVLDNTGKFQHSCKGHQNGLPAVNFSGALVASG